jgi:hypothetical protein
MGRSLPGFITFLLVIGAAALAGCGVWQPSPDALGIGVGVAGLGLLKQLTPFNNVAATALATLDVLGNVGGKVINRIILQLGGTALTKAMLTTIQLKASDGDRGGKLIFDSTGSRTDSRQQYRGIAANAAFLTVDFSEIRSKTIKGQKLGSIDTRLLKTLSMEVQITGATAPTLVAHAEYDEAADYDALYEAVERQLIGKCLQQTYNFAAAGTFPVKLGYGQTGGSLIKRIHFHGATVTGAEVRKNGFIVHQSTSALVTFLENEYARTPQANIYTVDFIVDGNQSNALNAADAQTMEYYVTVSGAGNVTVELELLDPLGNN